MKNTILFLAALVLLCFSSCSNMADEVWINADGSGKYQMSNDLSQLLPFVQMMMMAPSESGEEDVKKQGLDMMKKIFSKNSIDTVLVVEDLIKQSIEKKGEVYSRSLVKQKFMQDEKSLSSPEQSENLWKFMEGMFDLRLRIRGNMEDNMLKTTLLQDFKDPNDMLMSSIGELMKVASKMGSDSGEIDADKMESIKKMMGTVPSYSLSKKTITISRKGMDMSKMSDEDKQGMEMMSGMIGKSDYKTTIHVPGIVKSVSQKGASYSGSTVTWTIPYNDMYDPEADLDLKIKFKPKKNMKY